MTQSFFWPTKESWSFYLKFCILNCGMYVHFLKIYSLSKFLVALIWKNAEQIVWRPKTCKAMEATLSNPCQTFSWGFSINFQIIKFLEEKKHSLANKNQMKQVHLFTYQYQSKYKAALCFSTLRFSCDNITHL